MIKQVISWSLRNIPRKYLQLVSHWITSVYAILYRGKGLFCPVCEKSFKKFLPYGRVFPRENALCPSCMSLERHRLLQLYLREKTNFYSDTLKVLHIAPEYCFINRFEKLTNIHYLTADLESPLANYRFDLHTIPFDNESFDVIFCNHVLEHVEDDIQCIKEIYRVLKKKGWAILQSPQDYNLESTKEDRAITDPKEREKEFLQSDHFRIYGLDYGKRLELGGFQVIEDDFLFSFTKEEKIKFALPEREIIYVGKK